MCDFLAQNNESLLFIKFNNLSTYLWIIQVQKNDIQTPCLETNEDINLATLLPAKKDYKINFSKMYFFECNILSQN